MSARDVDLRGLPDLPLPVVWRLGLREVDLPPYAKLSAYTVDTFLGGKSSWRVSVETIARGAGGISPRTVQYMLKELEDFFDIEPGGGRKNPHRFTRRLTPETVQAVRGFFERAAETVQLTTETVQLAAVKGAGGAPVVGSEIEKEVDDDGLLIFTDCMRCLQQRPCIDNGTEVLCDECRQAA